MVDNPKFTIGLNEAKFGLVAPFWFVDSYVNTVGHRHAELGMMLGKLFKPDEALKVIKVCFPYSFHFSSD